MTNVTSNILRGALEEVKRQLDSQAETFETALEDKAAASDLSELSDALDGKVDTSDLVDMTLEESDTLFDSVFRIYRHT